SGYADQRYLQEKSWNRATWIAVPNKRRRQISARDKSLPHPPAPAPPVPPSQLYDWQWPPPPPAIAPAESDNPSPEPVRYPRWDTGTSADNQRPHQYYEHAASSDARSAEYLPLLLS